MNERPTPRKRRSFLKKLMRCLVILLASALALELLTRGLFLVMGKEQHPSVLMREILDLKSAVLERIPMPEVSDDAASTNREAQYDVCHPFYGMDLSNHVEGFADHRDYYQAKKDPRTYSILIVGGSVAARFSRLGWKAFKKVLHLDPRLDGKNFHKLNVAKGGFKQPQQTALVAYLLASGFRPDAVINIDGFNEVAIGFQNASNGAFPLYPHAGQWGGLNQKNLLDPELFETLLTLREVRDETARTADMALKYGMHLSAGLGSIVLMRLNRLKTRYAEADDQWISLMKKTEGAKRNLTLQGPTFASDPQAVIKVILDGWVESSVSLKGLCDARSIPYLHVLQPTLHDPGAKPMTEEERRKGAMDETWLTGVASGYPKLRERGAELKERGVNFKDCSMIFRNMKDTVYFDCCHFQGPGMILFARAVAVAFLEALPPR